MRRLLGHKWLEPVGFLVLSPAMAGIFGRMRIGGSSTKAHTAEGGVCLLARPLFGSGSAGLGSITNFSQAVCCTRCLTVQ
jgi:hypothetical protein